MQVQDLSRSLLNKLLGWVHTTVKMLPNAVVAALVIVAFWMLSKLAFKISERALRSVNKAARSLITTFIQVAVILTGAVIALGVLNLDKALASVLAGAGIVGLALGFAFQDLAANIISGVGLALNTELPFQIGDTVETNEVFGVVRNIHLRTSTIETLDGKTVVIPNKQIYQDVLTNHSAKGTMRVELSCGISYGDDLRKVRDISRKVIESLPARLQEREVQFFYEGFGDSSIDFVTRFWIRYTKQSDFLSARSEAVVSLKEAFDRNGITIPFPIRTLDFGIVGGERLADVLDSTPLTLKGSSTSGKAASAVSSPKLS